MGSGSLFVDMSSACNEIRGLTSRLFFEFNSSQRREFAYATLCNEVQSRADAAVPGQSDVVIQSQSAGVERVLGPPADRLVPLHFTMLTIGSRGDVQPYIALAQRLLRLGHRVRIATHVEFGDWILEQGITDF